MKQTLGDGAKQSELPDCFAPSRGVCTRMVLREITADDLLGQNSCRRRSGKV